MTIQVKLISAETESRLAAQAAARQMDVPAYAATLLERAAMPQPPFGRKSLAQLFAESPFKSLDLDFERDPDVGREVAL